MTSTSEVLHVTSGDVIADALQQAFPGEEVIAWRDVLHEGPIPAGLDDDQLASIRAGFLASCGWGSTDKLRDELLDRNRRLCGASNVMVWFEYDMHDQLHLLQVLSMIGNQKVSLVEFAPARVRAAEDAMAVFPSRREVSRAEIEGAKRAREAVRGPQPSAYWHYVSTMPYLEAALRRFFEQIPGSDGLSRTERQILEEVQNGHSDFGSLMTAVAAREEYVFLGDSVLKLHLKRLTSGFNPPLTSEPYRLTEAGTRILSGESNLMEGNGIDRWVGGAHFWTH